MNNCVFTGNLGRDCTTSNVNGTAVCNFSVAAKSGYGDREQTIFIDCALWGKRAETGLVNYLTKGKQVAVSGELGTREYQAKDGTNRTAITLRVSDVTLMGGGGGQGGGSAPAPQKGQQAPQRPAAPADDMDDSIPF